MHCAPLGYGGASAPPSDRFPAAFRVFTGRQAARLYERARTRVAQKFLVLRLFLHGRSGPAARALPQIPESARNHTGISTGIRTPTIFGAVQAQLATPVRYNPACGQAKLFKRIKNCPPQLAGVLPCSGDISIKTFLGSERVLETTTTTGPAAAGPASSVGSPG